MNKETLKNANELARKIQDCENALHCFEYDVNYYARDENPDLPAKLISTNPRLVIDHDDIEEGEGRTQTSIPIVLSEFLIGMIKSAIKENQSNLQAEFDKL